MPATCRGGNEQRWFRTAAAPTQVMSTPLWHLETRARVPRDMSTSCRDARAGRTAVWGGAHVITDPPSSVFLGRGVAGAHAAEAAGSSARGGRGVTTGPQRPEFTCRLCHFLAASPCLRKIPRRTQFSPTLQEGGGSLSPNFVGRRNTLGETAEQSTCSTHSCFREVRLEIKPRRFP